MSQDPSKVYLFAISNFYLAPYLTVYLLETPNTVNTLRIYLWGESVKISICQLIGI